MEEFQVMILPLLRGLGVTLQITAAAALLALPLAVLAGLGRLSTHPWLRWPATVYVQVFRGTSALVQLFWFYFVLPLFGLELPAMAVGIAVLAANTGAYGAEVVRGAIAAVPAGQREAARALNMPPALAMRRIVLPQAMAAMLPPATNLLIELLKNTALVSLITITDLTFSGQLVRSDTLRTTPVFLAVLILYFIAAQAISAVMRLLEKRVAVR